MSESSATKRKSKVLIYTTEEFVQRLLNRGYHIKLDLKHRLDVILQGESKKHTLECHSQTFWSSLEDHTLHTLQSSDHFINVLDLCAQLSPLHKLNINYVNIAVVLYSFTAQDWKNLYRYYYLEWMKCNRDKCLWVHTPRYISKLDTFKLQQICKSFLDYMIHDCENNKYVHSLFFINRLYLYLTPCG